MNTIYRRAFLGRTGAASLAITAPTILRAAAPTERINVACIGTGGMGTNHVRNMAKRADLVFSWVCDTDSTRAAAAAKTIQELSGQTPRIEKDMRRVLEDKSVQAVV